MSDADLTLADLKADQEALLAGTAGAAAEESGADWLGDLIERLDQRGVLDALIARQFDLDGGAVPVTGDGVGDGGPGLDARAVATFGKMVMDQVGDVPISEVVKYAEGNPEVVDRLIDQATGGGA